LSAFVALFTIFATILAGCGGGSSSPLPPPANRAPTLADIADLTIPEDATEIIQITASDPDQDSLRFEPIELPAFAVLMDNGDGSAQIDVSPGFEDSDTYPVSIRVVDSGSPPLSAEVTFSVVVDEVNRAPSIGTILDIALVEDDTVTVRIAATDPDRNLLRFECVGLPAFAVLTDYGDGSAQIDVSPGFDDSDMYPVSMRVIDDGMPPLSAEVVFTVMVDDVNRAPVIDPVRDIAVVESDILVVPLTATDPDGNGVSFSSLDLPDFMTLVNSGANTAELHVSPDSGDIAAEVSVTIDVIDDGTEPLADQANFDVTVLERRTRVFAGIVSYYPFTTGAGSIVIDQAGDNMPFDLVMTGDVTWLAGNDGIGLNGGVVGSNSAASKIISAIQSSGESSFEIWALPGNDSQTGPARMISLAANNASENFMLGQDGTDLEVRLLHTGKGPDASPRLLSLGSARAGRLHLLHTYDGNVEKLYVNGILQPEQVISDGSMDNWDLAALFEIGNRTSLDRPFLGEVYLVAVYDRALSLDDVHRNYSAGPNPVDLRPAVSISFTDVTSSAGVSGPPEFGGHGIQFADVDGDSLTDMYVTRNVVPTTVADMFYHNKGDGTLDEEASARGIADSDSGSHSAIWADFDNDGDFDLFNGSFDRNRLYRNDGNGSFQDVTGSSGLRNEALPTRGATALDMDGDGDLDIFAVTNYRGSNDPWAERNEVYRNDGDLKFTPVAAGNLESARAGQGTVAVDFDNDGDLDVFAGNRTGDMNILRNNGSGSFSLVNPADLDLTISAGDGVSVADVNNDGWLDLMLDQHLFTGTGGGQFRFARSFEVSTNHYMGGFADLDNDGDFDLSFPGRNYVYLNDGTGIYSPSAIFAIGAIDDPRSVAFADVDNDGDLDLAYAQKRQFSILVRNDLQSLNRWIKVDLRRQTGQVGAFGSRIIVFEPRGLGDDGRRITWQEVAGPHGYMAQDDPEVHLGVGRFGSVDIRVIFPNGATVDISDAPTNTVHVVQEP